MRPILFLPVLIGLPLISGCASFNAMPDPIFTVKQADSRIRSLEQLAGPQPWTVDKPKRNSIISTYLMAADARYLSFLRSMSRQTKGANFGLDAVAMGLSSISAIAKGLANELATGSAIAAGARGSFNKEVLLDRTLPALISAMEARRLEVRGQIEKRMKEEDVASYTLEQGFADIMRYQMATTLDGAIQQITADAGKREDEAQKAYKDAVDACDPSADLETLFGQVNERSFQQAKASHPPNEHLKAVAELLGAPAKTDGVEQAIAINEALERSCSMAKARASLALLPAQ